MNRTKMEWSTLNKSIVDLGVWDFEVHEWRLGNLILMGGADLDYYHDVVVEFQNVEFVKIRSFFSHPVFESGHGGGTLNARIIADAEGEETFLVCCEEVRVEVQRYYRYNRENLGPDERIADWVKS